MRPDDYFAAEDAARVMSSPYLRMRYAVDVPEPTPEEAQILVTRGEVGRRYERIPTQRCPYCGQLGFFSGGHRACNKCRQPQKEESHADPGEGHPSEPSATTQQAVRI